MAKPHRIAAGGLIFRAGQVLLVRYRDSAGGTYLVGPGGALLETEAVPEALVRETLEETGVVVEPGRVILLEDIVASRYKMLKVWMTAQVLAGEPQLTEEAEAEGIVEVGWYHLAQLEHEVVYPALLKQSSWTELASENWAVQCWPSRRAGF